MPPTFLGGKMNKTFIKTMECLNCGKTIELMPNRKYCEDCRQTEYKKRKKVYYATNRKHILARCSEYRKKNKKHINEWHKEYYDRNKKRLLLEAKEWHEKNKDKAKRAVRKHHNLKNFGGNRERALERDKYTCQICGSGNKLMVHHIDEKSYHNSNNPNNKLSNLITLCQPCHNSVHAARKYEKMKTENINYNHKLFCRLAYE